jgi:hypothetical protein
MRAEGMDGGGIDIDIVDPYRFGVVEVFADSAHEASYLEGKKG